MRCDPVLLFGLCGLFGAAWVAAPLPASLVLLLLLALFWERYPRGLVLVALCVLAFSGYRAHRLVNEYRAYHAAVGERLHQPERCGIVSTVTSSPTVRDGRVGFFVDVERGECESFALNPGERLRLGADAALWPTATRGTQIDAVVQLSVLGLLRNRELPDPTLRAARVGVALRGSVLAGDVVADGSGLVAAIDRLRAHARRRIEATFSAPAVGMAKALVLGENDLDPVEGDAFKASGLSHLLAVSGTHLVFAVLSLVAGLRFVLVRIGAVAERTDVGRGAALIGALLALLYADFAGGSGSAWRAAWMLSAALGVRALGREPNVARAVGASLVVGWLNDALAVFDVSFMLSLAATFGLLTLGRWGTPWVASLKLPRPLRLAADGFLATLSSMVPCAIPLATLGPNVSLMGIAANVLAAPFGETVALPLCLVHPLTFLWPELETGLARVASGALLVVRQVALFVGTRAWLRIDLPYPTDWQIAVALFATLCGLQIQAPSGDRNPKALLGLRPRMLLGACAIIVCAALEGVAHLIGHPRGTLRITVLDVGQGDAALIDFPDGSLMLIDAGGSVGAGVDPGERVIAPLLRVRRRTKLDVVVLSHPHPDHYGGLAEIFSSATRIEEFWDTGQGQAEGAGDDLQALLDHVERRGVRLRRPQELCGVQEYGGTHLEVLAPCPTFTPQINANDNSFVMHLQFGRRSALLTGDAELAEEAALITSNPAALRADFLKVGHHGSRTSSSAQFVAAVAPTVAAISCGQGNRFGHPHREPVERLEAAAVRVLRTDQLGSVAWATDGEHVLVRTFQD